MIKPSFLLWLALWGLLFALYLSSGSSWLSPSQLLDALTMNDQAGHWVQILWQLRLPRAIQASLTGALLGICGAAIQGLYRNPLAEPSLVGVSGGAMLFAALALLFGASLIEFWPLLRLLLLPISAFGGGLLASYIVLKVAQRSGGTNLHFILTGLAINILTGAGLSLCLYLADDGQLRQIFFWQMGSLSGSDWQEVALLGLTTLVVTLGLMRFSEFLNVLMLGESEAHHLGYSVARLRKQMIWLVVAGVATAVSFSGVIGFVGLIIPHILRFIYGAEHKNLMLLSAIFGACFLLACDWLARTLILPLELPIGVVTALIGGSFFIYLLGRKDTGIR